MDLERARSIVESHGVIEVKYHGAPVWIENINDGCTVQVSFLDTKERAEVPVEQLEED